MQITDKKQRKWNVELNGPLLDRIEQLHSVDLSDLDNDPLQKLRNNPRKLIAVLYLICEKQIQAATIEPEDFAESLPYPPDEILEAIGEAIVNFFPTGRHTHVREILAKFAQMAAKADEILVAKMTQVFSDQRTTDALSSKADEACEAAIESIRQMPIALGPLPIEDEG